MSELFDKTFFKLFCGFTAIIFFSLTVFAVASLVNVSDSQTAASVLSSLSE
jgi:hypothetical protein